MATEKNGIEARVRRDLLLLRALTANIGEGGKPLDAPVHTLLTNHFVDMLGDSPLADGQIVRIIDGGYTIDAIRAEARLREAHSR